MSSRPWYRWFSADYRAKTAHLDFIHDAAYRRLLDAYYEHRGPLPADPKALCRIVGAQTAEERQAVIEVASEFFSNGDDRIRQARADFELAEAQTYHERMVQAGSKGGLSSAQARLKQGRKPRSTMSHPHPQSHLQPLPHPSDSAGVGVQGKGEALASKRFATPSLLEVRQFIEEHRYAVDPVKFWNHYEANGWRVGRNPMKNWQAAVRTWSRKEFA